MKLLIAFAAIAAVVACAVPVYEDVDAEWFNFKQTYGKIYKNTLEERQRRAIFASNFKMIKEHNELYQNGLSTYFMKVNKYADLTTKERAVRKGFKKSQIVGIDIDNFQPDPNVAVPDTFDWRPSGAVTRVKDQGQCGSCWAFSVTGTIEGAYFFKTGQLVELSEQNIVDCSTNDGNSGCDGGDEPPAIKYVYENDGISSEEGYPYEAVDGRCRYDVANNVTSVRGYGLVKEAAEDDLKAAVAQVGPISIAIDASWDSFDYYGGGVYYESNCGNTAWDLDHAVLAVGYGTENNQDYWLVKNSWAADWGDAGYIKMARNRDNNCGVATEGVYPLMY